MEMRIPTDKECFQNFIIQNRKTFGDSFNNGFQKDIMCSFRKRTDVKQKTEDPKAQYLYLTVTLSFRLGWFGHKYCCSAKKAINQFKPVQY